MIRKTTPLLLALCLALHASAQLTYTLDSTVLSIDVVVDSGRVDIPWEILWAPDQRLWMTDGPRIVAWDPMVDQVDTLLERPYGNGLGMALHPDFLNTPQVFAVFDTAEYYGWGQWCEVIRFDFDALNDALINDTVLLAYPHVGEHGGGRLLFDDTGHLLLTTADYWLEDDTIGHKMGKVLRMTTNGEVPADNPTADHTWTRGHRNPQGLARLPNGNIVVSEHGQGGNNEINLIQPGLNYGWAVWDGNDCTNIYPDSCASLTYVVEDPLITYFEPPAGTEFYTSTAIPEFTNTLLTGILWFTGMKVFSFDPGYGSIVQDFYLNGGAWSDMVRIRDIAIHPDGSIYLITNDRQDAMIRRLQPLIATSLEEHDPTPLSIWPNPAHERIHMRSDKTLGTVILFDMCGRAVLTLEHTGKTTLDLDISHVTPGLYLLRTAVGYARIDIQ